MQNSSPFSPVTGSSNVSLKEQFNSRSIINQYRREYDIDVQSYFDGIDRIDLYECLDTGYRFFYPLNLCGKSELYEQLQRQSWYYLPWKWEYSAASEWITLKDLVLEVGCGRGEFLKRLTAERQAICTGLELNEEAVRQGSKAGLKILNQEVQAHAQDASTSYSYDVVCSFQVLEHISLVKDFISACCDVLKPGGKLIFGVPNNNPFLFKYDKYHTLNLPPHHMGLWNQESLTNLQNIFHLKLQHLKIEPLQKSDSDHYYHIQVQHWGKRNAFCSKVLNSALAPSARKLLRTMSHFVQGRNILVVYEKL